MMCHRLGTPSPVFSLFPTIGNFSNGWKIFLWTLFYLCLTCNMPARSTNAVSPAAARCIEACMLVKQQAIPGNPTDSWDAFTSYSNAPGYSLELFSVNGASLYIKGSALTLSDALLAKNPAAASLYRSMQKEPSGDSHFFCWNDSNDGLNRTDVSWLHCDENNEEHSVVVITCTQPFVHDSNAPLAGSWVGAFTEKQWSNDSPEPAKNAGQMNALFLPYGQHFFFRFYGQGFSIHGHGLDVHNRLSAISTPGTDTEPIYWYMDAALETGTNTAIRGTLTGTFNDIRLERKFYLRKLLPNHNTGQAEHRQQ